MTLDKRGQGADFTGEPTLTPRSGSFNYRFEYSIDWSCPSSYCKDVNSTIEGTRIEECFPVPVPNQTQDARLALTAKAPFDYREADDFYEKSISEHTRRAYRQVVREFFIIHQQQHPAEIKPKQILAWRDSLLARRQHPHTVTFKLSIIRSFYEYLRTRGVVTSNPAATNLVPPPELPEELAGRALTSEEARRLLAGPDRSRPDGARDYALLLSLSLRVSEACSLNSSQIKWSHGRWTLKVKVKGRRERTLPLPDEVRTAIKEYLKLDAKRRRNLHSGGENAYLFQPLVQLGSNA